MAQPTRYDPAYDFSDYQTTHPTDPLPGDKVDVELAALQATTDDICDNLALIQRDDGALANGVVTPDSFSTSARALVAAGGSPEGAWATSTAYAVGDLVSYSGDTYICVTAHTSGTFATDLAAGKWLLFANQNQLSATPYFQRFSGTGSSATFTLSQTFGTDEKAVEVYVSGVRIDPTAGYTLSGNSLTINATAGTNNVWVFAPDTAIVTATAEAVSAKTDAETAQGAAETAQAAAQAAQGAAETAQAAAEASANTASAAATAAQNAAAGIKWKAAKAATTANITLSGTQTIDGVSCGVGDRVLVKDQSSSAQNGIYVVASGAWARSTDADEWDEIVSMAVSVEQGSTNGDRGWICTSDSGGTLGSTAVNFSPFGLGDVRSSNNLSDLLSAASARANLGLAALATKASVGTTDIDDAAVTLAKLANLATKRGIGRNTGSTGVPEAVTIEQMLDWLAGSAANGDMIIRSGGSFVRLPKGTDGQLLKLASGLPSWADVSSGAWEYVTASSISSSSFSVQSLASGYDYIIAFSNVYNPSAAGGEMGCRVEVSSSFQTSSYESAMRRTTSGAGGGDVGGATTYIQVAYNIGGATSRTISGYIEIVNPADTTGYKEVRTHSIGREHTNNNVTSACFGGGAYHGGTGAVTGLQVFHSSNSLTGDFAVWRRKRSA